MSGSLAAVVIIPIVTVVIIAMWITLVWRAGRRRPERHGPGHEPARHVAGGIFRGDPRQVTPRRDVPPPEASSSPDSHAGTTPGKNGE
jgi:hypothetical protein